MTDAEFAALVERLLMSSSIWFDQNLHRDLLRLIAELERLRAREKAPA